MQKFGQFAILVVAMLVASSQAEMTPVEEANNYLAKSYNISTEMNFVLQNLNKSLPILKANLKKSMNDSDATIAKELQPLFIAVGEIYVNAALQGINIEECYNHFTDVFNKKLASYKIVINSMSTQLINGLVSYNNGRQIKINTILNTTYSDHDEIIECDEDDHCLEQLIQSTIRVHNARNNNELYYIQNSIAKYTNLEKGTLKLMKEVLEGFLTYQKQDNLDNFEQCVDDIMN